MLSKAAIRDFQVRIWDFYAANGRDNLPWRSLKKDGSLDPYKVLVSEIMLQQTQVARVIPKYLQFLDVFPDVQTLNNASIGEVLQQWTGLGYNRRAKFLHQAAQKVVHEYGGTFPTTQTELTKLPGVGVNTAGAIVAYAFDKPVIFVETNIRTVFIHHFFADQEQIPDSLIREAVEQTLPTDETRAWYWALMDYGSYLKGQGLKLNVLSKTYSKQSTFEGSRRQIRGHVIRLLGEKPRSAVLLESLIADERLPSVLHDLEQEGLIRKQADRYYL